MGLAVRQTALPRVRRVACMLGFGEWFERNGKVCVSSVSGRRSGAKDSTPDPTSPQAQLDTAKVHGATQRHPCEAASGSVPQDNSWSKDVAIEGIMHSRSAPRNHRREPVGLSCHGTSPGMRREMHSKGIGERELQSCRWGMDPEFKRKQNSLAAPPAEAHISSGDRGYDSDDNIENIICDTPPPKRKLRCMLNYSPRDNMEVGGS
ncbi:hypothetical protein FOZ60_001031 [Perkinsus olseni]|uniref:Uncharacterized protein n=1 Tax=Perkinsus olseni TaxID=32597 RepID=A0A7J6MWS5_PEROL|nr:hypothetical protein FOZ60_001031 [Perkinsus olseni]